MRSSRHGQKEIITFLLNERNEHVNIYAITSLSPVVSQYRVKFRLLTTRKPLNCVMKTTKIP